jgi:4-diphosphocytidyl-2-C-methyl-D-erythritol kinase
MSEPLHLEAAAKVNLSLQIKPVDSSGMHPLRSLAQSIDRLDHLTAVIADEDRLEVGDAPLSVDRDNLIWKAVDALRDETNDRRLLTFGLSKQIPIAAGLAGGSADAAAALRAASQLLGISTDTAREVAARVGADVPFCLQGGLAWMEGYGERLTAIAGGDASDFALAVAVPPFWLPTAAVYRRWDDLGGPQGRPVDPRQIPPRLREYVPFVNDLTVAAVDLRPELGDWVADLEGLWDRPVMLSGSGPSLFGYFEDTVEATEAAHLVPDEARARFAAAPVAYGVRSVDRSRAEADSH